MANLIAHYDEMTGLVSEVRVVKAVYLDLSKAFNTHCCTILREKVMKYGLNKWRVRWAENWLNCLAQQAVMSGMKYYWRPILSGVNTESDPETSGSVQPREEKAQTGPLSMCIGT